MKEQTVWVPKFTQLGFERLVIPSDLYKMLVDDYERVKPDMAEEVCIQAVINCQDIQDLGDESIVRSRRRTFIMELRWFAINIITVIPNHV